MSTQLWNSAGIVYAMQANHSPGNVSAEHTIVPCRAIVYDAGQHLNSIAAEYTMCMHSRQHELLTRDEWILASIGGAANVSV